jgi:hypothetical protein
MRTFISNVRNEVTERASRPLTQPDFVIDYHVNGLTYASDDTTILPRDTAGNISIEPSSSNLLVIEPILDKVTTASVLKVIDTSFQYYKFPVSTIESSNVDLDVNIDFATDTISTRYVIPYNEYPAGVPNDYARINTSTPTPWFTNGGETLSGFLPLPFTGDNQPKPYSFVVTRDTIDTLKAANKTIKFFIQAQFSPNNFSLNTGFRMRLRRSNSNVNTYKYDTLAELYTQTKGEYNSGDYPLLTLEYILNVNDLSDYDTFVIEVMSGNPAWCLGNGTIWNIDVIDIPFNGKTGVISISGKTSLLGVDDTIIIDGRV